MILDDSFCLKKVISTKGEASYTNKIDNWSLGVILYICLVGYPPFSDEGSVKLEDQIKNGVYEFPDEFWSDVSENAKDLIRKLLCVDPEKRISLDEALEHDWIKKDFEMKRKAYKLMYKDEENLVLNGSKKRKESPEKRSQESDDNNYKKRLRPSNSNTTDKSND
jgi:serine/threonine-protein kinase CHEK2